MIEKKEYRFKKSISIGHGIIFKFAKIIIFSISVKILHENNLNVKIFYAFIKEIIIKLKLCNAIHLKFLRKYFYVFLGLLFIYILL